MGPWHQTDNWRGQGITLKLYKTRQQVVKEVVALGVGRRGGGGEDVEGQEEGEVPKVGY